jgi:hypothetical protein
VAQSVGPEFKPQYWKKKKKDVMSSWTGKEIQCCRTFIVPIEVEYVWKWLRLSRTPSNGTNKMGDRVGAGGATSIEKLPCRRHWIQWHWYALPMTAEESEDQMLSKFSKVREIGFKIKTTD